jgi:pimeloyl-ACP methyl ester carboxylesterase
MGRLLVALVVGLMLAAPVQAASVGGAKINYTTSGSGRTVVFVHGWTCDLSSWDAQVAEFSKSYRVIALDLPGHGKTAGPTDGKFSMALFAEAIEAVRAEVGAGKIVLVGHSMGAPVIRQYALMHPDRVAGLVAVDGPLDMRAFPPELAAQMPKVTGPDGMQARKVMISSMFTPTTSPAVREHVMTMMTAAPEATAGGAMNAMFDPAIRTADVIQAPALSVYAGGGNFNVDPKTTERLPRWEGTKLAGTGHFVMMEKPAEFNALLADFLARRAEF